MPGTKHLSFYTSILLSRSYYYYPISQMSDERKILRYTIFNYRVHRGCMGAEIRGLANSCEQNQFKTLPHSWMSVKTLIGIQSGLTAVASGPVDIQIFHSLTSAPPCRLPFPSQLPLDPCPTISLICSQGRFKVNSSGCFPQTLTPGVCMG